MEEKTPSTLEIMDLTRICQSFPRLPEPLISRDNLLDTIERMFGGAIEIVMIEGDEGLGKTMLLTQFAMRHPNHAFSVFIKAVSRFGYDPSTVRYDLCCQLRWALHQDELGAPEEADDGYLRKLLLELRKRARRETFYFVLDGLADIPDESIRSAILDLFPLGEDFSFLLSGTLDVLPNHVRKRVECKSWPIVGFSLDETIKYFADSALNPGLVEGLYQACGRGIPGHLVSARRNILAGQDPQTLLKDKLTDLYGKEWNQILSNEIALKALAIVTHALHRPTVEELSRLLGHDRIQVKSILESLSFLTIDNRTSDVSFESDAFRKFAITKLQDRREQILDMIINDLVARPESVVSLSHLPSYFEQKGKLKEVLECLSPDYFARIVEYSQSLVPVRQKADLGISAAMALEDVGQLLRLSMQKSVITELEGAEVWRSEIEALMALNDYTGAMNLTQSMLLKEDRLHLLAVIAKSRRESGQPAETELLQQIRTLYDQIDPVSLGERAIDIASDLFYSCPDLAIDLVERAAWTEAGENALDMAYTRLSLATLESPNLTSEPRDTIEVIRARIKDPKLRSLTTAISLAVGTQTAREVIAEVERMNTTEDRLYLLRQWAVDNRERSDAPDVAEYALDLSIKTTSYAPNARVLRELAAPLPFIKDKDRARRLVGIFDGQKNTVEHIGPTEDYVRLQLLLARAERIYDSAACSNRIDEVYLYIHYEIDDLAVKASCLAWLLTAVNRIDPKGELEAKGQIRHLTTSDLEGNVNDLLQETAEHFQSTRSIIQALAISKPDMGLDLAKRLNTQIRRDKAIQELIEAMMHSSFERFDFDILEAALKSFADQDSCDEAITMIIERVSVKKRFPQPILHRMLPFINRIAEIRSAHQRCLTCCLAHSLLSQFDEAGEYNALRSHLLNLLGESWHSIDVGWAKVDTGFQIVRLLAEHVPDLARDFLIQTESTRKDITFDANATAWTYQTCLRMAVRAFAGLLPRHVDSDSDYARLKDVIEHLPSSGERAMIWAELAERYFIASRSDDGKRIVTDHVKPLLYAISENDESYRADIVVSVAPALYRAHIPTAKDFISRLPRPQRDEALIRVAEFMLRKRSLSDPYESHGQGYDINFETILDIIEVLHEIESDSEIFHFIESIAQTVGSRRSRDRFTRQQRVDIAGRLEDIASVKFPDLKNITHDGYKIAAQGQIARIRQPNSQGWEDILIQARAIPNRADRAFVLSIIGASMPSGQSVKRKRAFEEAVDVANGILSSFDRISRLVDLASIMMDTESSLAKNCLRSAMESIAGRDASGFRVVQRKIVDLAFKLDPDLAASLASLADDDPARGYARTELNRRLETLKLKNQIINELPSGETVSIKQRAELPRAAWMVLGSLNAGRVGPMRLEQTRESIRSAANYRLREAYPILSWIVENAVQRLSSNPSQASSMLRQVFDATLLAAEIFARMATRFSGQVQRAKRRGAPEEDDKRLLVSAGDRERVLQFLRDWFTHEVKDYLKICDEYFGPSDIEVLMLLRSANPRCKAYILTSKKHQSQEGVSSPDVEYLQHWRCISDQDPPETEIVIVGIESSGKSPIHDRLWLTKGAGLKMGTSFNSLGKTQYSSITRLSESEANLEEINIDQYLLDKNKFHNGERLRYISFTL